MLFLSVGVSHQAHWSDLCTRTKAEETECWISRVVKFTRRFYFRLLLPFCLYFDSYVGRHVQSFMARLNTCRCKRSDRTPVLICPYDSTFFFDQFRHARVHLHPPRHLGHQPFEVYGRHSILDNTLSREVAHAVTGLWTIWFGLGVRRRQLCGLVFLRPLTQDFQATGLFRLSESMKWFWVPPSPFRTKGKNGVWFQQDLWTKGDF